MPNNSSSLKLLAEAADGQARLYESEESQHVDCFIASTAEGREILTDSLICGGDYTARLESASRQALELFFNHDSRDFSQNESAVLNVLRGGLAFGLRSALRDAQSWNAHRDLFLSCQREKQNEDGSAWDVRETNYKKLETKGLRNIFLGEVVATGTTLRYALGTLLQHLSEEAESFQSLVLVVIGGAETVKALEEISEKFSSLFEHWKKPTIIFLEGIFAVPSPTSHEALELPGTDLVLRDAALAPEFTDLASQNPTTLVERCVVYDSGARAFNAGEYHEELAEYWNSVMQIAEAGTSLESFLTGRIPPELLPKEDVSLSELSRKQLERIKA